MWPLWVYAVVVAVAVATQWVHWRWTHRRMLRLAAAMPGPRAWPLVGNALVFMARPEEILENVSKLMSDYGEYVRFWLGPDLNVCINNPADIKMLLTSNKINRKGPLYEIMKPYIGPGILSGGPCWRNHRKMVTPSYNKKSVLRYAEVFNRECAELATLLAAKDPTQTFNVYLDVVNCTTQCVCQTLMGLSKSDSMQVKRMDELVLKTQTMYNFMFEKMTKWWLQIPIIFWLTGRKRTELYYMKLMDDLAADIVEKRRREMEVNREEDDDVMNVVDRFLLSGELSLQEIKWETFTVFTTSQEASAKIASTILVFLAHLPEWQEKVYNEITEILGPEDTDVSYDKLKKMQHLDAVFNEAIRWMAIAAFIQRTVEEEVSVNDGKLTLPAGSSIIIPIHNLHRDPRYWDEPYKVKPERFLPENCKGRDPNAYVPFSLGLMDCIGRVFATRLIKTLVVRALRRVRLRAEGAVEDLHLHVAISVKFANGYNLRASPRE